jgi:hypothetical protein
MTLITSGIAVLACQGCASHLGGMQQSDIAAAPGNPVEVSAGMAIATKGAFTSDFELGAHPYNTQVPGQPVIMASPAPPPHAEALVSGEQLSIGWPAETDSTRGEALFAGLDWSSADPLRALEANRNAARLAGAVARDKDFQADFAFDAPREATGLAFDIGVAPSLSYTKEGQYKSKSVGAQLRIGRNFDQRGSGAVAESWYVFAGAEGEALVWETGEYGFSNMTGAVALRDQVTVGDMQAGVSIQRGPGQLSLSFIRREVKFSDRNGGASEDEDFAGVSFTLRR